MIGLGDRETIGSSRVSPECSCCPVNIAYIACITQTLLRSLIFHMMTVNESRHYGEWALSSWYEILPGPDRLLEVSTSSNEDDAWLAVHSWCTKLLTPGIGSEKLQEIADSLIHHHWNQAKRMGCLGVQFTYINGFYHRFIWRVS